MQVMFQDGDRIARFGFDLTPTQPPLECCPIVPVEPTTLNCTCGVEGNNRIVGGEAVPVTKIQKFQWNSFVKLF